MPITQKGITSYTESKDVPNSLFTWLAKLQLLFPKVNTYQQTLDPSSVPANDENIDTFTVTGLTTMDIVTVNPPALAVGIGIMWARVSATDTLQIKFRNFTGAPINPASGSWLIKATRL